MGFKIVLGFIAIHCQKKSSFALSMGEKFAHIYFMN